jgi:large subunit ribosomal protein L21
MSSVPYRHLSIQLPALSGCSFGSDQPGVDFHRKNPGFSAVFFSFSMNPLTFAALMINSMLAVVKISGQQFTVKNDQTLFVPRVEGKAGDKIELAEVLLFSNDGKLSAGKEVKATIKAEILDQVKGDKVIAFKMKRRKGFRKKHGHRTHYTKIKIESIA